MLKMVISKTAWNRHDWPRDAENMAMKQGVCELWCTEMQENGRENAAKPQDASKKMEEKTSQKSKHL